MMCKRFDVLNVDGTRRGNYGVNIGVNGSHIEELDNNLRLVSIRVVKVGYKLYQVAE